MLPRLATMGERQTEVGVDGPQPTEFVGTLWTGAPDDRSLRYLTADPERLLAVRLLWPDVTRIDGYVYLNRADVSPERRDQIDRLVAAKRERQRQQNYPPLVDGSRLRGTA